MSKLSTGLITACLFTMPLLMDAKSSNFALISNQDKTLSTAIEYTIQRDQNIRVYRCNPFPECEIWPDMPTEETASSPPDDPVALPN